VRARTTPPGTRNSGNLSRVDARAIVGLYAQGLFPMDDPGPPAPPELPWWVADPRTIFELDEPSLAALDRRVRRSLRVAERAQPPWELRVDGAFDEVIACCARPRHADDGVWLTKRMHHLYRVLYTAGFAHTFEIWAGDQLAAGMVGVTLGRAAMLESMFHRVPHAGNVLVAWTLRLLAERGCVLCDIQTATEHTLRLGAVQIPRGEYERRLAAALA
jgi:leucyl/phenylalanyl-tRNA--protein transferase